MLTKLVRLKKETRAPAGPWRILATSHRGVEWGKFRKSSLNVRQVSVGNTPGATLLSKVSSVVDYLIPSVLSSLLERNESMDGTMVKALTSVAWVRVLNTVNFVG